MRPIFQRPSSELKRLFDESTHLDDDPAPLTHDAPELPPGGWGVTELDPEEWVMLVTLGAGAPETLAKLQPLLDRLGRGGARLGAADVPSLVGLLQASPFPLSDASLARVVASQAVQGVDDAALRAHYTVALHRLCDRWAPKTRPPAELLAAYEEALRAPVPRLRLGSEADVRGRRAAEVLVRLTPGAFFSWLSTHSEPDAFLDGRGPLARLTGVMAERLAAEIFIFVTHGFPQVENADAVRADLKAHLLEVWLPSRRSRQ